MSRRVLTLADLLAIGAAAFALAGCGSKGTVAPLPQTVEGPRPTTTTTTTSTSTTPAPAGDATAGKAVFASSGCGSCHTYAPAGTAGTVGPNLDKLAADAQKANQGSLSDYTKASIVDPGAYVVSGFSNGVMPTAYGTSLSPKQIADLVAFLTQKS